MEEETKKTNWKDKEVGAIWENKDSLFIIIGKDNDKKIYKAFRNKFKNAEKQPDWKVFDNSNDGKPITKHVPKKKKEVKLDEDDSDVVF